MGQRPNEHQHHNACQHEARERGKQAKQCRAVLRVGVVEKVERLRCARHGVVCFEMSKTAPESADVFAPPAD